MADDDGITVHHLGEEPATYEVTVAHASFRYHDVTNPRRRPIALRGETITVGEEDYQKGMAHDAFVDSPDELTFHGEMPSLATIGGLDSESDEAFDEEDQGEINDWMRSASPSDVDAALEKAKAEGMDLTTLARAMAVGESERGSEARSEVLQRLEQVAGELGALPAPVPTETPADEDTAMLAELGQGDRVQWVRSAETREEKADRASKVWALAQTENPGDTGQATLDALSAELTAAVNGDTPPTGEPPAAEPPSNRIDDIVAWVDGDKARAQQALDREGETPRPRLVSQLKAVLEQES